MTGPGLRQLPLSADRAVRAGLDMLAERVRRRAADAVLANRDPARPLPSKLSNSVRVSGRDLMREVGSDLTYAPAVELGTSRQSAEPFLQPALDATRREAASVMRAALRAEIGTEPKGAPSP